MRRGHALYISLGEKAAREYLQNGTDPAEAIAKIANENNFNVLQTKRLIEYTNQIIAGSMYKKAYEERGNYDVKFPVVTYNDVQQYMYNKTASVPDYMFTPDELDPEMVDDVRKPKSYVSTIKEKYKEKYSKTDDDKTASINKEAMANAITRGAVAIKQLLDRTEYMLKSAEGAEAKLEVEMDKFYELIKLLLKRGIPINDVEEIVRQLIDNESAYNDIWGRIKERLIADNYIEKEYKPEDTVHYDSSIYNNESTYAKVASRLLNYYQQRNYYINASILLNKEASNLFDELKKEAFVSTVGQILFKEIVPTVLKGEAKILGKTALKLGKGSFKVVKGAVKHPGKAFNIAFTGSWAYDSAKSGFGGKTIKYK